MLTSEQITAGTARLVSGKLTGEDVGKLAPSMRAFFGSLATTYSWDFDEKLAEMDDDSDPGKKAAQVAAMLIAMEDEELGFGVARLTGAMEYSETDAFAKYMKNILALMYPVPEELSTWDLRRRPRTSAKSSSIRTRRSQDWC